MTTTAAIHRPDWLTDAVWPFEIHALDVGGATVAYTDVGEGPTLLFSHAGLWSFVWRDLVAALCTQYRCVTFDPPGSGLSQRVAPQRQSLEAVRVTVGTIVDVLDLRDITLVMHDLGGVAALAAAAARAERYAGLVAVNTFGWHPAAPLLRLMLALFGSAWMRELDAWTGWLPAASATGLGAGGQMDRASRRAFRRGMDRPARRMLHRLFASARTSPQVYRDAERALDSLSHLPLLTVFGAWSDYLGFQPQWRQHFPGARQVTIARGLHFPMAQAPAQVAGALSSWHADAVARH